MITIDNFYTSTEVSFKACKRPKRLPNYVSKRTGYHNGYEWVILPLNKQTVSSEYWYAEDKQGKYVIRSSNHWSNRNDNVECKKVASCKWSIHIPRNRSNKLKKYKSTCGKAYLQDFKQV